MTAVVDRVRKSGRASRLRGTARAVLDQAVATKIHAGRLRDEDWPYGLRAVVAVGATLFVLTGLLALLSGPIRSWSSLTVPNSLSSSVPDDVVWLLVFLLAFCLALFTTAAIHGPWWLATLGIGALALLLGIWSAATTTTRGLTLAVVLAVVTLLVVIALVPIRRGRGLGWWEFPLVLGLIGLVLTLCALDFARTDRLLGYRWLPVFVDQTMSLLVFLVLPAAFAAGAAVAEIAVGITMAATRAAQRAQAAQPMGPARAMGSGQPIEAGQPRRAGRWPFVVLAAAVALRLVQEVRRLVDLDWVSSGWIAVLPAVGLVAAFAGLGWLVSRLTPLDAVPVNALPDELGRIAVPVGAAVIAMMLPVYVLLFGWQILVSVSPTGAPGGFDPSPLVDRLVDGFRVVLGFGLIVLALWRARWGSAGVALVLGGAGLMLVALGMRLLTAYRWALWLDPDALISVVTVLVLTAAGWLLARRRLSADRALGLAAVLVLAALLSARSVVADPFAAVLGYTGVAFILFGVAWDFLTSSHWANVDGRRVRRPVRVLLAVGYPLLTVTVVAADALIRRPRTTSYVNAFAELGELILGTALLAAAAVVVLAAVRGNREVS
ncbi:MAG TPA: hypothetical protein VEX66_12110 [Microlunatus sp.]|nr:hypothetical protein [Microlunatus sp.]